MSNKEKKASSGPQWILFSLLLIVLLFVLPSQYGSLMAVIFLVACACLIKGIISLISSKARSKDSTEPPNNVPVQSTPPAPSPVSVPAPAPAPPAPVSAQTAPRKAVKTERIHVRGVDKYRENVLAVASENPDYDLTKRELIEDHLDEPVYQYDFIVKGALVPDPDNEYDPNAIMVQANGLCIGYVPRGSTAHVRKLMESGRIKSMDLDIGGGKYKQVYEVDDDEYELDRDEKDFSAVLDLFLTEE